MAVTASFNVQDFENLIQNHGYNCYWSQAIICECYEDGQPSIHCPFCEGRGWRYLPKKHLKVVSTSFTGKQEISIPGLRESGTVYITPPKDTLMGYHDKLEFYEISSKHSQVLTMRKDKTSATYRPIEEVLFIMIGNYVYEEDIDFEISGCRHYLEWIDQDAKPKEGSMISALYTTTPEYVVTDISHELRSVRVSKGIPEPRTEEMPKQYQARRVDFIYGKTVNEKKEEYQEKDEFNYG